MAETQAASGPTTPRERMETLIHHLEHVLPGQAPIRDFVHHNTIHGYQHLSFPEALSAARRASGNNGYLPQERFREFYGQGRIERADLDGVLSENEDLACDEELAMTVDGPVRRLDVYRTALLHDFPSITSCQLGWQIEEMKSLTALQPDIPGEARERLLKADGRPEAEAVSDLWQACLDALGLEYTASHAEDLTDLSPKQAESFLGSVAPVEDEIEQLRTHNLVRHEADRLLGDLFGRVGPEITLRGLLQALTGRDILEELRPLLVRHLGSFLDQGMAAWHNPHRGEGFFAAWKRSALADPAYLMEDFPDWRDEISALPEDALSAIADELSFLGLPEEKWDAYLERLALELPGWSGMVLWRHLRPGYQGLEPARVEMADYLAVRLVLERLFALRLSRAAWKVEPRLDMIRWHFKRRRTELMVRWALFNERLPEYLASRAHALLLRGEEDPADDEHWRSLAHMIWTWRLSPAADRPEGYTVYRSAWPLFHLAQHLGLTAAQLRACGREQVEGMLDCLARLDEERAGYLWLQAYERHYRDQIFTALNQNFGRGRWAVREQRPSAQVMFCMDDREEGIRRHLEERNPDIETLGAAAHYGVFMNWWDAVDGKKTPLCPVVAVPAHDVHEHPRPGAEAKQAGNARRRRTRLRLRDLLFRGSHRGLIAPALLSAIAAPWALVVLAAKVFAPYLSGRFVGGLKGAVDRHLPTRVDMTSHNADHEATPESPRDGFTDDEQADRLEGFLRNTGLTYGFSPLVAIMGHGSDSQNNPHRAAYDCGACSGRHSGPNARVFAGMANRTEVRARLRERGIDIPDDTHFLGAFHNTGDETIDWFDVEDIPAGLTDAFATLRDALDQARRASAHERCRRLASAPKAPSLNGALAHMIGRATDFSQARPELGHATNASAFIGRRSATQGAFFDRRMFLISYDPTQDADGTIIERLLLANGPVGAGISLEYYFSTVDNENYGCGSKVTHNLIGALGVMEGTSSDLRTGLPRQMIEIHEAMRLLVVVEQSTEVLTEIYMRQPPLQELVGNAWIQLAAQDPDSGEIQVFRPGVGWEPWTPGEDALPMVERSTDWYVGHSEPLTPVLLKQPQEAAHG